MSDDETFTVNPSGSSVAPGLTDEEKAYILELLAEGKGSSEIAQLTDRDPRTINKFARKSNVEVKKVDDKGKLDLLNLSYIKFRHLVQTCNDGHTFRSLVDSFKTLTEIDRALVFDPNKPGGGPSMVLNFQVNGAVDLNMDVDDPLTVEGEVTKSRRPVDDPVDADDEDFALLEAKFEPK